jgi:hypothetical protein
MVNLLTFPDPLNSLFARSYASTPCVGSPNDSIDAQADESTGSKVNLELAGLWLRDCLHTHHSHDTAWAIQTQPILPSRVVHVSNGENPYLFETQGEHGDYLTLSYCWGQGNRLLTTKKSYKTFQSKLPMDNQMPLTFREAIQVTKALGYRYIWIDALCIIQDDSQDLQQEMARMGDIYYHSTMTIFAAKGQTTDSGLFANRNGLINKPRNILIKTNEHDNIEERKVAFGCPEYQDIDPLSKRGWVSELIRKLAKIETDTVYPSSRSSKNRFCQNVT